MLREMIPLLLLFLKIVLSDAQADDNVQQSQLPDGKICLFTCSEWIFKEKVQQFAPSADLLGPGYLSKHKIGFLNDDSNVQSNNDSPLQYQKVWGAVYSINKAEYDAVLKQSQSEYSIPFESNEDVFVVKYNEMNCLVVDLGIQPGDHPPWRHFNMKIPNTIQDDMYYQRLAQIGVPQDYIKGLRNASITPKYHPIIPLDYHPRQDNQPPKRTYDQLPTTLAHPAPHQFDNQQPITGQIPDTHDQEIPGLSGQNVSPVTTQSNTRKLLPGVSNPNSPLSVINTPGYVQGQVPLTNALPGPHDVQVVVPKDIDSGVTHTAYGQPVVAITPMKLPGSSNVQPGPDDVQVTVPNDIDSGVTHTPDGQPVVLITPLKLPGSTTNQPVMAQSADHMQHQSPVILPGKNGGSNVVIPPNEHVVNGIDNAVPTKVTDVDHPTLLNPTVSGTPQSPLDDQSYVVITPLKLPQNKGGLNSAPVGPDYKVQTPSSLQPNDVQTTFTPKTIDHDYSRPEDVPPILLGGPQQPQVTPDYGATNQPIVTQPQPHDHLLLSPDTVSPPTLPISASSLLINPPSQLGPESLPTSYDIPNDHNNPGSNSGLLTLSPDSNLTPNYQNDSPLLTLNDVPTADHSTNSTPTPQVGNPSLQPHNNNLTTLPYQQSPNTVDLHNPNLLQTNTAPQNLQPHTAVDHRIHSIPDSFGVSKLAPIIPKPMFGFDQTHPNHVITHDVPTSTSGDNQPLTVTHQPTSNIVNSDNKPDLLLTNTRPDHLQVHPTSDLNLHSIPASFAVPKPAPAVSDKPMFTLDQPNHLDKQSPDYYQINPHTLDINSNPDLLNTNTGPNHLQLQPTNVHPITQSPDSQQIIPHTLDVNSNPDLSNTSVHSIPASYNVSKPTPVIPNKPMFGFNYSNYHPSTIPATFGISGQPPVVQDKPMFSLGSSPSSRTPKHIDNDSNIPSSTNTIPLHTVDQPHATGLLYDIANNQNDHPGHLVSQPDNVPLTTTAPDSHIVQLPSHTVDNNHPDQLTSQPNHVSLGTTNIPPSSVVTNGNPAPVIHQLDNAPLTSTNPDADTVQHPNHIVSNDHPVHLTSQPSATAIPQSSTLQASNAVVNNGNPAALVIKPNNVAITPTESPTITQNDHPDHSIFQQLHDVSSQPINIAGPVQTPKVVAQPIQRPSPTYSPSTFMAPNYTPVSPVLGYSFAHRYPQYLHNSAYKPPNYFYQPDEIIPGFTFGSHIQLC